MDEWNLSHKTIQKFSISDIDTDNFIMQHYRNRE